MTTLLTYLLKSRKNRQFFTIFVTCTSFLAQGLIASPTSKTILGAKKVEVLKEKTPKAKKKIKVDLAKKNETIKKSKNTQKQIEKEIQKIQAEIAKEEAKKKVKVEVVNAPIVSQATPAQTSVTSQSPSKFYGAIDIYSERGLIGAENYAEEKITLGYKVTETSSFSFNPRFTHYWGAPAIGENKFQVLDPYAQAANSNIYTFAGGIKFNGYMRAYLPLSESSQISGQYLYLRPRIKLSKDFSPLFSMYYYSEPRYFFQSVKSVELEDGTLQGNRQFNLRNILGINFNFTDKLYLYSENGLSRRATYEDIDVPGTDNSYFESETGIGYVFNSVFELTIGIYNGGWDIQNSETDFSIYGKESSAGFLDAVISF